MSLLVGSVVVAGQVSDSRGTTDCHPTTTTTIRRANLDSDSQREAVAATNVTCAHDYSLSIVDECEHRQQSHWLRGMGATRTVEIVEANSRNDGRELFYVLRRGKSRAPDLGTAAVVHLSAVHSRRCRMPRFLLIYQANDPAIPPPRGWDLSGFDAFVGELTRRYPGREIRLVETFIRGQAERRRTMLLRYSSKADRYVIYSPKL